MDSDNRFSILFMSTLPQINNIDTPFNVYTSGDIITIENISGKDLIGDYVIYNIAGQRITNGKIGPSNYTTFVSDLPSSSYILEIFSNDFSSRHKITIQQ